MFLFTALEASVSIKLQGKFKNPDKPLAALFILEACIFFNPLKFYWSIIMFITTALSVVIYHYVLCIVIGIFGTTNLMFKHQIVEFGTGVIPVTHGLY